MLKPSRLRLTFELMKAAALLSSPNAQVCEPRDASRDEILLFHEEQYLNFVERVSVSGSGFLDNGDTPAFRGCYGASALAVGASLTAVDLVMSGKATHAMNIAGGLHHAHPDRASGFCIFNDPAISIAYLKRRYGLRKILYLDVDAHHGDGVMYGFYSDGALLDIDFHEDGRHLFPGSGFPQESGEGEGAGFKINVPIAPFTGEDEYLHLFRKIVPLAVRKYRPEMLLLQCGADSHANDLLAHLQLTTRGYGEIIETVHSLAHEVAEGRLIVFGGGGYNIANVARTWTVAALKLAGCSSIPQTIPQGWRKLFEALVGEEAPTSIESYGEANPAGPGQVDVHNEVIMQDLERRIPLLR